MTDTANLAIWDKLGKTDPAHTKKFSRAGGFKGTAIKPIYTTQKMTEEFGPAGKGWGMGEPSFQTVPGSDGQVAVYCTVALWWVDPSDTAGTVNTVYGVGGDMVVVKQSSGLRTDDEAFKKAFTDAVGNAMKHLGMSADVHMGLFDDSKYVASVEREIAQDNAPAPKPKAQSRDNYQELQAEIDACQSLDDLVMLWNSPDFKLALKLQPEDWQQHLIERKDQAKAAFEGVAAYVPPDFDNLPPNTREAVRNLSA